MEKITLYHKIPEKDVVSVLKKGLWPRITDEDKYLPEIRRDSIIAIMSPNDPFASMKKNEKYLCVSFELNPEICLVGDMDLAVAIREYEVKDEVDIEILERWGRIYEDTLIPLNKYRFGTFRCPEILVNRCLSPDELEILGENHTNIFGDNYDIYLKNTVFSLLDYMDNGIEMFFYLYCEHMVSRGIISKISTKQEGDRILNIYMQSESQRVFSVYTPQIDEAKMIEIISEINRLPDMEFRELEIGDEDKYTTGGFEVEEFEEQINTDS